MESSGQGPAEPEVPLADAAIATEIARAAARGRGADRSPTLEQLLAAFGESAPTDAARRRVRAALRVAGMGARPDVMEAEPGQRLLLLPPGAAKAPSRGRAVAGLVALALLLLAAVAAAAVLNSGDNGGNRASDALPADTTTTPTTTTTAKPAVIPGSTTTTLVPAPDTTETPTTTTDTTTTPTAEQQAADDAARRRRARARRAREKAAAQQAASAGKTVVVRVDATNRPTFLCVDDGNGKQLFAGTLDGRRVFKAERVRLNIGLASTRVTVDGTAVTLNGSPTGLDVTRKGGAKVLPLGSRPCA